jgi:cell division initiation protein
MELTPQAIREVEFREKLRGYHPDDVDAFVEQVATAVEQLLQRLGEGTAAGPAGSSPGGDEAISEETIRRTLVMAQRTADMVLTEAQESAARVVAEAQAEAEAVVSEAKDLAERTAKEEEGRLKTELARLGSIREQLQEDIAALEAHAEGQHSHLREVLFEHLYLLDAKHDQTPAPPVHDVGEVSEYEAGESVDGGSDNPAPPSVDDASEEDEGVVDVLTRSRKVRDDMSGDGEEDVFLAELRRAVEAPGRVGESRRSDQLDDAATAAPLDLAGARAQRRARKAAEAPEPEALRGMPEGGRIAGRLFRRR